MYVDVRSMNRPTRVAIHDERLPELAWVPFDIRATLTLIVVEAIENQAWTSCLVLVWHEQAMDTDRGPIRAVAMKRVRCHSVTNKGSHGRAPFGAARNRQHEDGIALLANANSSVLNNSLT